jgi:hypothetical protein
MHHKTRKCGYERETIYATARPADAVSVQQPVTKVKAEPKKLTAKAIRKAQTATAAAPPSKTGNAWNANWASVGSKATSISSRSSLGTSRTSTKGNGFSSDEEPIREPIYYTTNIISTLSQEKPRARRRK